MKKIIITYTLILILSLYTRTFRWIFPILRTTYKKNNLVLNKQITNY